MDVFFDDNPECAIIAVKYCGMALKFIDQSLENYIDICIQAVKSDGCALQFVSLPNDQTNYKDICMKAVKECGYALQFVKNKTYEICLEAVKRL